jgi:hypothetical protein
MDYAQYRVQPESEIGPTRPWRSIFSSDLDNYTQAWSVNWFDLDQGNNSIEVQVFDLATNKNSSIDTIYILKDIEPPTITATKDIYGWYKSDPGPVLDMDFSNKGTGSDLSYFEYRLNDGNWIRVTDIMSNGYSTPWSVDWSKLVEGDNNVEVRVWDVAGFSVTQNFTILKDTTKPIIEINKKEYGWYQTDPGRVIDVDFKSESEGSLISCSALDYAEYKIGDSGNWNMIFDKNTSLFSTAWSLNWSELFEGVNKISIRCSDVAGNLNISTYSFIVKKDTQPPVIKINTNIYGWFNSAPGDVIDIDFINLDQLSSSNINPNDHSNITNAQYKLIDSEDSDESWKDIFGTKDEDSSSINQAVSLQTFTDNWNVSWDLLSEGENVLQLRLFDEAGNVYFDNSMTFSIFKDTTQPIIIIRESEYGWYNQDPGSVIDVNFSSGDDRYNSPLASAEFRVGEFGSWSNIFKARDIKAQDSTITEVYEYNLDWGVPWKQVTEGINTIYIRVYDEAGNFNSNLEEIEFKRDTIGPEPPLLVSPVNNGVTIELAPVHYWLSPNDPGSNKIGQYHIQVDTTDEFKSVIIDVTSPKLTFAHENELALSKYYWRVRGIDIVGNIGDWSSVWQFDVVTKASPNANQPPTAEAGEDRVVFINEDVVFNGSGSSDPENDNLNYIWYLDGDPESDAVGQEVGWKYTSNGNYTVILEVFDDNGGYDFDVLTVNVLDSITDSDDDGMSDDWERYYGLNPNDPKDAMEDLDNDGFLNNLEFASGSLPIDSFSTPITANDKTPPKITHKKVISGQQLVMIEISATVVDDDSGVREVNLYYKKKTDEAYNSVSMGSENIYSATIPASMVTLDDLEYYIEAIDNSKHRNSAYFGSKGQVLQRPSRSSDIDIDVKETIPVAEQSDAMEEFIDTFSFKSFEMCLMVFVIFIILLSAFGFASVFAVRAKQMAHQSEKRRTIKVVHGNSMTWEGFELENLGEDEDMNLLAGDEGLDEV